MLLFAGFLSCEYDKQTWRQVWAQVQSPSELGSPLLDSGTRKESCS